MTRPRSELLDWAARAQPGSELLPLAGDASTRRFHRLVDSDGCSRIVMDYGEPFDDETDDVRLSRVFHAAGLRVARVLDVLPDPGLLVLEDLGDATLESVWTGDERALLERAVRLAARIASLGSPELARSGRAEALDAARFRFEMDFFLEHWVSGLRRRPDPGGALARELHDLAERAAEAEKPVLCHRDFHSRNLMVLDDGQLAMVDIQDARWGPDGYDLASLLRDAYIDVEEAWVDAMLELYRAERGSATTADEHRRSFDVIAAQRMIKALGTFGYQSTQLGRTRYRDAAARTSARLDRLLRLRSETERIHALLRDGGLLLD